MGPLAPSTCIRCASGDTSATCNCRPGKLFYGPQYTNELDTTNSSEWIVATTIEMMLATGLIVGYKRSGNGKCWYQKGFLDFDTRVPFGKVDPLPGIGTLNRQCFCTEVKDVAPLAVALLPS